MVTDDTAIPKKGMLSVGVTPQHCCELGKQANNQSLVSLLARGEVPVPIGRFSLPTSWADDLHDYNTARPHAALGGKAPISSLTRDNVSGRDT